LARPISEGGLWSGGLSGDRVVVRQKRGSDLTVVVG